MPLFHMLGMRHQIGSGLVKLVIEVQIDMVGLQVHNEEHGWSRPGKLSECII
jgi:hypothetical protein